MVSCDIPGGARRVKGEVREEEGFDPDSGASVLDGESALSVSQINRAIGAALEERFSVAFWVMGEIQGYDRDVAKAGQRRWGQVYFELIEKETGSDTVKAGIKALVWGDVHRQIRAKLKEVDGSLSFQDGLQVKLLCKVDFYWPRAGLQLKVLDVDPHFTLGDMERARRELIAGLKREGLFDRNRAAFLPRVPLTLGLITSDGSAAYHDFVEELRASGFSFRLHFFDARMQGADTERDVVGALSVLGKDPEVDAVVLVRGGGSRSDLLWFDKEKIARAVARCPKPVLAGIGHEIDLSVTDLVAHTSRKTPTAVAQCLVDMVRLFESSLMEGSRLLREGVDRRWERESRLVTESARAWRERSARALSGHQNALARAGERLRGGARRHVMVAQERLRSIPEGLKKCAQRVQEAHGDRLERFRKECDYKDPRRLLARGYSLIYAGGRIAKNVGMVRQGEWVEARLSDGTIVAHVLSVNKEKP